MDSSSSSFDVIPPEFTVASGGAAFGRSAMFKAVSAAEDVLTNLGFVGQNSFIPERFARNWYDKVLVARRKQMEAFQQEEIADMLEGLETPSRNHSGRSTPMRHHGNKSEFLHNLDINSRNSSMRRSKFRRAATILSYHQDAKKANESNLISQRSMESQGSFEKQDSIDQLKFVLERQASILNAGMDQVKDRRRRQFVGARQKSLPLSLETLSEEDEGRTSKRTSLDKGRMKNFLEEEERLYRSSSGESERREKHRDSMGSESSAVPNTYSSATSADCSDQEAETENMKKVDNYKIEALANLTSNKRLESGTLMNFRHPVLKTNNETSGNLFNHVLPLLDKHTTRFIPCTSQPI